ncbi:uncharacterized protein TrAFT101_005670 [Trichoderma asperellum]|uniref:uncharacterized protein n=1 Tax=Trichoderma asperellum TaxID=101201 RepID=UPI00332ECBC3|nr:hypothetical protein TrAFT101_005670 [Trichoderma asperellum]
MLVSTPDLLLRSLSSYLPRLRMRGTTTTKVNATTARNDSSQFRVVVECYIIPSSVDAPDGRDCLVPRYFQPPTFIVHSNVYLTELEPLTAQSDRVSSTGPPYSVARSRHVQQSISSHEGDELAEQS